MGRLQFPVTDADKVSYITGFYEDAKAEVLDYCYRDDVVGNMASSIRRLAVIRYNQEGNEGESSRSEGGVSQSFEEGMPKSLRASLNRYRVAKASW